MRTIQEEKPSSVQTADLDAASWLYYLPRTLLDHHHDGHRTIFAFEASPQELASFYGQAGESARKLLLARRTLLGLVHEAQGGRR